MKFAEAMMDKPLSFYAFEMLYWCGIREGELLALTPADFDFEKGTVTINKSYQRLNGQDIITSPKTEKSNRTITMPKFLADEMQDFLKMLYGIGDGDRMFTVTKSYLYREMERGAREVGVKRIRVHDLRHSHVSLLIDMGFSATAIADRVGHESIEITYNYAHLFPSKQTEMADRLDMCRYFRESVLPNDPELQASLESQPIRTCQYCGQKFPADGKRVYCSSSVRSLPAVSRMQREYGNSETSESNHLPLRNPDGTRVFGGHFAFGREFYQNHENSEEKRYTAGIQS